MMCVFSSINKLDKIVKKSSGEISTDDKVISETKDFHAKEKSYCKEYRKVAYLTAYLSRTMLKNIIQFCTEKWFLL